MEQRNDSFPVLGTVCTCLLHLSKPNLNNIEPSLPWIKSLSLFCVPLVWTQDKRIQGFPSELETTSSSLSCHFSVKKIVLWEVELIFQKSYNVDMFPSHTLTCCLPPPIYVYLHPYIQSLLFRNTPFNPIGTDLVQTQ